MKDDSFILTLRWIIGGGAALTICYMIGIALGVTRLEAPAWVQAVGSISAIWFAWFMGERHSKRQDIERQIADLSRKIEIAELCEAMAKDALTVIYNVHSKFTSSNAVLHWEEIGTERLNGLLSAIDSLFAKDIPPALFSALLPVQREIAYTLTAVRQYNEANQIATDDRCTRAKKRLNAVRLAHTHIDEILLVFRLNLCEVSAN